MAIENYKAGNSNPKYTAGWSTSTTVFISSPPARQRLAEIHRKGFLVKLKTLRIEEVNLCILKGGIPLIAAILFGFNVLRPRALIPIMLHNNVSLGNKTRTK